MGEILLTCGVLLLLFVAWKLWWTNVSVAGPQQAAVRQAEQEFKATPKDAPRPDYSKLGSGDVFGIIYIPRFGPDYQRPLAEGVTTTVLDTLGIGHYPKTAMPGEVGNAAFAGHRQTNGAVLDRVDELGEGDRVYVRMKEGYYIYKYKSHRIVLPTQGSVLAANPVDPKKPATEKYLTLTTCHPRFGDTERYIVLFTFERFVPNSSAATLERK